MDVEEPRIKELSEELVAKIAAGEVITSPVNVVKELVENCLDAKSTLIHVSVKDKGTYIKVKDNGIGFNKDDLPLACLRHATSKLSSMSDFETLENYGFRGEALSSISQVADVKITTKKKNDLMGSQATYKNGKMISCKKIAANDGTLDRDARAEVVSNVNASKVKLVEVVLGRKVASNLLELKHENAKYEYSFDGLISNTNATLNRYLFILFINNRLVDCSTLKTTIKEIFSDQLMKGMNPFVYLNLKIVQKNLDVNLHPSKREVRYLNEDVINSEIGERIQQCLVEKGENQDIPKVDSSFTQRVNKSYETSFNLSNLNSSLNSSLTHSTTPKAPQQSDNSTGTRSHFIFVDPPQAMTSEQKAKKAKAAYTIIRNDGRSKKIDDMFAVKTATQRKAKRDIRLESVQQLRKEVDQEKDIAMTYQVRQTTLVGIIDHRRILVQHKNFMKILDFFEISKSFMYQQYLMNFGNFKSIDLKKDIHLIDLLGVFKNQTNTPQDFNVEESVVNLIDYKDMYYDYFSMKITDDGFLRSIPIIIDGYRPNLNLLPFLIWRLTSVMYKDEKTCFTMIGKALADFYSRPLDKLEDQKQNIHAIYSRFKEQYKPTQEMFDHVRPVADLQNLYKIFERC